MNIPNIFALTGNDPDDSLHISNNGPEIVSTNYCQSFYGRKGLMFVSRNAGTFRLLVPPQLQASIAEMRRGAKHVVLSLGEMYGRQMIEWMVEDGSNSPLAVYLEVLACDLVFGPDDVGQQWRASVWDFQNGKPHKCIERPAYCRIVPRLPCIKRIGQ